MLTFFFATTVKAVNTEEKTEVKKEQKDTKPQARVKKKTWKELFMSFTPLQLQALQVLFNMSPEERQRTLAISMTPNRLQTSVNDNSPHSSSGESDTRSVASDGEIRIHHKNQISELAKYLSKNWFSARKVWRHIYNDKNRICDERMNKILAQIQPKLTKKERKLLKLQKEKVVRSLKKKIAAARRYRLQAKTEARKRALEAPMANTIDLSLSADEDEESENQLDGKSEDQLDDKKKDEKDEDDEDKIATNGAPACRKKILLDEAKKFTDELKQNRAKRLRTKRGKAKTAAVAAATATTTSATATKTSPSPAVRTRASRKRKCKSAANISDSSQTTPKKKHTSSPGPQESSSPSRWRDRHIPPDSETGPTFKVGAKVMGCWKGPSCKGDWYEGVIHTINEEKQTVHIIYNDGDFDKNLKWSDMTLL